LKIGRFGNLLTICALLAGYALAIIAPSAFNAIEVRAEKALRAV
jgi:hypothetical protein